MDELNVVKDMAPEAELPNAAHLAAARGKLMSTMAPRRRRFGLAVGWTTVGVAAAAAAVIVGTLPSGSDPGQAQQPAVTNAAMVLHEAADAARRVPDVTPQPDQFVYVKIAEGGSDDNELWLSVDGTHDGIAGDHTPVPGCRNGKRAVYKGGTPLPGASEPCTPNPAYQPNLPTTAAGMTAQLKANGPDLNAQAKYAMGLLEQSYLTGKQKAALFDALSQFPGLTVRDGADGTGRPAVLVTWPGGGGSNSMVFDRASHEYLGTTAEANGQHGSGWLIDMRIVDKVGQR